MFVSLPKDEDPMSIDLDRATELIEEKRLADAPIHTYEKLPVSKGVGRFGPFLKFWIFFEGFCPFGTPISFLTEAKH